MGHRNVNADGKIIEDLINTNNLKLVYSAGDPRSFMHYSGSTSIIDLFLVSININDKTECIVPKIGRPRIWTQHCHCFSHTVFIQRNYTVTPQQCKDVLNLQESQLEKITENVLEEI